MSGGKNVKFCIEVVVFVDDGNVVVNFGDVWVVFYWFVGYMRREFIVEIK